MKKFLIFFFILFLTSTPLFSHEKHEEKGVEKEEIVSPQEEGQEGEEKIEEKFVLPPIKDILFSHLHNKLIHFPIVLSLLAFLFFLFPGNEKEARFLLILAAAFTIPVYFTGEAQSEFFEGKEKEYLVELHEQFGIFTIISIWIFLFLSFLKIPKIIKIFFGVIVVILVMITGLYGGICAH
ncbi:MAG: hypothetical protein ABIN20_06100 [candidate division WOR-3 bacterium]